MWLEESLTTRQQAKRHFETKSALAENYDLDQLNINQNAERVLPTTATAESTGGQCRVVSRGLSSRQNVGFHPRELMIVED